MTCRIKLARDADAGFPPCPDGVYQFLKSNDNAAWLQISAQRCVFGETRDIKGPIQNIVSIPPETDGPDFLGMKPARIRCASTYPSNSRG